MMRTGSPSTWRASSASTSRAIHRSSAPEPRDGHDPHVATPQLLVHPVNESIPGPDVPRVELHVHADLGLERPSELRHLSLIGGPV